MYNFLNIYTLPPLVSSMAFLALGFFIYLKNRKAAINRTFLLVCLVTFWWQFSWFILFSANNAAVADYLVKIGYIGIIFIPITFYHFFTHLIGKATKPERILTGLFYVIGLVFVYLLFFTDYLINGFYHYFWSFYPRAGVLHPIYLLFLSFLTVRIFYLSLKELGAAREISSYRYYQIKYVLLALVVYIAAASDFAVNYGFEFYPFGFLFILVFLVIFAYTIVRHRLMDIKMVLRRSFVYLFSVMAVAIPASIALYLANLFSPHYITYVSIAALIFSVSVFSPIRDYFYRIANKYFFSSLYDAREVISKMSDGLRSTLDVSEVYNFISETLTNSFHAKSVSILKYDAASNCYVTQFNKNFFTAGRHDFPGNSGLQKEFADRSRALVVEEIKSASYEKYKETIDLLLLLKVAVLVPLKVKDEVLGIIALGEKESGDMYNDEDLRTLETISSQAAISIKNAQLYDETKKFSRTLQAEVERQTAQLQSANKELQQLDKAKSDFISIASHQLRTPLTAIKGFSSMILEGSYGKVNVKVGDKIGKIFNSAERLIRLVNDLLDLSHMESGKMELKFVKIDFDDMVKSVIEELEPNAINKKLELTKKMPDKEFWVRADEQKLRQVVMNLIDNAIKYTQRGSVSISLEHKDGWAMMAVKDTGMGMHPGENERLFEKFMRGADASHYNTEGAGVGLYVAKKLIEEHKGKIWAESPGDGLGSTFFIGLPEYTGS